MSARVSRIVAGEAGAQQTRPRLDRWQGASPVYTRRAIGAAMATRPATTADPELTRMYAALEEGILDRDQVAASDVLYDLIRAERPLTEILRETVRIHAPYTQAPYHQRIDDGIVRFVNNDHCLLSARASLRMPSLISDALRFLPVAQTMWYVPTALDAWNQLLGKAPGHYGRATYDPERYPTVPRPTAHREDTPPSGPPIDEADLDEQLNEWLTLVQRGEVAASYELFQRLLQVESQRPRVLAQLMFAGLIDVQDRVFYSRSYTTGHKSFRARATIELGTAVGWEHAHDIVYAGVPDLAVGPRWYSSYEMACQVMMTELEPGPPASTMAATVQTTLDEQLFAQDDDLTSAERESLMRALLWEREPAHIHAVTALLRAGRSPRKILDTMQIACAQVVLETQTDFSIPQHAYEHSNTLAWFYANFQHRHRTKLLYVAGSFINQAAMSLRNKPGNGRSLLNAPARADRLSRDELLRRLEAAMEALEPDEAASWVQAYLDGGYDRSPLLSTLAMGAAKQGNDPHNQELGFCFLEDYQRTSSPDRNRLLLACAKHTAGHRKYGDSLEAYRRFTDAFDLPASGATQGDGEPIEAALDEIEEWPAEPIEEAADS